MLTRRLFATAAIAGLAAMTGFAATATTAIVPKDIINMFRTLLDLSMPP